MIKHVKLWIMKHFVILSIIFIIVMYIPIGIVSVACFTYYNIAFLLMISLLVDVIIWFLFNWANLKHFRKENPKIPLNKDVAFNIKIKASISFVSLAIALISILVSLLTVNTIHENVKFIISFIIVVFIAFLVLGLAEREDEILLKEYKQDYIPSELDNDVFNKIKRLHVNDMTILRQKNQKIQRLKSKINFYNKQSSIYRILHKV